MSGILVFILVMCFCAAACWLSGQELTDRRSNLSGAFMFAAMCAAIAGAFTAFFHEIMP